MEEIEVKTTYWKNGNINTQYPYLNGSWHGTLYGYHKNGKVWYINKWRNGHEDGLWMRWHEYGSRARIQIMIQDLDRHGVIIDFKY